MASGTRDLGGSGMGVYKTADLKANKSGMRRTMVFVRPKPRASGVLVRTGVKGGSGTIEYEKRGSYQGTWRGNVPHGYGTRVNAKGHKYEGHFVDGRREGQGTLWVKSKEGLVRRYAGEWRDGKPWGTGAYQFPDGSKYEGELVDGKRHGRGTMVYADGTIYEGNWEEGERNGVGVVTMPNGDAFEGHFLHDKRHGPGRYFYAASKKMYEGEWVDDVPKCGVMSDAPETEEDFTVMGDGDAYGGKEKEETKIPELALRDADSTIRHAVEEARAEAVAPIGDYDGREGGEYEEEYYERSAEDLSPEEIAQLEEAFHAGDPSPDDATIPVARLGAVLAHLGLDPSEEDVLRLCMHLGVEPKPTARVEFPAFAQVMAQLRQ